MAYSDKSIDYLRKLRESGLDWSEITEEWNDAFAEAEGKKTLNALRKSYKRYMDTEELSDDVLIKNLQTTLNARKRASKVTKENKALTEHLITTDEILTAIQSMLDKSNIKKLKIPKASKKSKKKDNMIMEAMISDTHFGLKTKSFNTEIARSKMRKYANTFIDDAKRQQKNYNLEKINILGLGDYMQSATMHKDSALSCETTNAQQIADSIESLFFDFLLPVASLGIPIEFVGMCGNHDREADKQFTVNPGITYYTYTIYKALEMLCKQTGLKNVKFTIAEDHYHILDVYGSKFLIHHGYLVKKFDQKAMEQEIVKRSGQNGVIISGIRMGHYHNDFVSSCGRYIVNGGLPSDDHFGNMLGYKSRPCQVINYYVDTKKRDNSFYHSFVVQLES
jgi:hypothetical protein